jgi:3,4-dihydroxy 2-butanone 4-phosphate synthase/GTP cyclohydrolase II
MEKITLLPDDATPHRQRTGRPFVTLSYAQSLDGCIAVEPGRSFALSGQESLQLTHQLRAAHQAILVGIGTVLADDPQLNVRLVAGSNPQPVVVDSRLRFPLSARLLQKTPTPWIATTRPDSPRREQLIAKGAEVLDVPASSQGRVKLSALLQQLGARGINTLMVEGGAGIITSFLAERLVDRLVLTIAPVYIGGYHATSILPQPFPYLRHTCYTQLGRDLIATGDLAWEETCTD